VKTAKPYPYLYRDVDKAHGTRWRLRAPGRPTITIKGEFGSTEFAASYRAAMEGTPAPTVTKSGAHGTIAALARSYLRSAAFAQLAAETQRSRRPMIDSLVANYGNLPIARLEHKHVRKILDGMAATPGRAHIMLTTIRTLTALALDDGLIASDPAASIKRPKIRGEIRAWTEDEIATYEQHYPVGTPARLALALALYTGQRASDLVRMGRQHIRNGVLAVRQKKTKTDLAIPLHPELKKILSATPHEHLTILVTEHGKPYASASTLSKRVRAWARQAGIEGVTIHGLRKSCCTRLAEAGCTVHEIQAISGHKSLKEVERYTRAAAQKLMAERAIARTKNA
jgi:integrase